MNERASKFVLASVIAMVLAALVFATAALTPQSAWAEPQTEAVQNEERNDSEGTGEENEFSEGNEVTEEDSQTTDVDVTDTKETEKTAVEEEPEAEVVDSETTTSDTVEQSVVRDEDSDAVTDTADVKAPGETLSEIDASEADDEKGGLAPTTTKEAAAVKTQAVAAAAEKAPAQSVVKTQATTAAPKQLVANGTYYIEAMKNASLVLDMSGKSKKGGGNAIVWNYNGGGNQQWTITCVDIAKNVYTIQNAYSKLFLDVSGGTAKNCANVIQWSKKATNNANQKWYITYENGGYKIASFQNKKYVLDIQGDSGKNGANVEVYAAKTSNVANQRWYLLPTKADLSGVTSSPVEEGVYAFTASNASTVLDVAGVSQDNGANVELWSGNAGLNQRFYVKPVGNGYYTIVSLNSGKSLDVSGESMVAGANVLQWQQKNSANQKWIPVKHGDAYSFISVLSGMALTSGGKASGANVYTWFNSNGSNANQNFKLTAISNWLPDGVYTVPMRANTNQVIDVPGNSNANGQQLEVWSSNNGMNQKFVVTKVADKTNVYTLQAANSGKYVADRSGKVVQLQENAASTSQQWALKWGGDGFILVNEATGQPLHAVSSVKQGSMLQDSASGANLQKVTFLKKNLIENGVYNLVSATGSRVMDVSGASKSNNGNIILWQKNNGTNQKFWFTALGNGYYKIVNANSNKAVTANGSNVYQYDYNGSASQQWEARVSPNGGLVFVNRANGKAIDVNGGMNANGRNIDVAATNTASAAERWSLARTNVYNAAQLAALAKANARGSKTNFFISVNLSNHTLYVFKRASKNDAWALDREWIITAGDPYAGTPTPVSNKATIYRKRYTDLYYPKHRGNQFYYYSDLPIGASFHSIMYKPYSTTKVLDGRLGKDLSAGCMRLATANAKWIYDNVPIGTAVTTYR